MSRQATDRAATELKGELERLYAEAEDADAFGHSLLSFLDELGRRADDSGTVDNVVERLAEQLDRAATAALAAGAMHDLRSLVQVLVANVDHARAGVLKMATASGQPDRARDVLRTLDELRLVAATMANITRDGVALQRAAGATSLVELSEVLETTARMHRRVARGRLVLDDVPRVHVVAPRGAMLRVLANLIRNAIDAIPEDQGRVTISAWVATDDVFVQVSDNGPGIPEALQGQVFDMFFTTKDGGSGVGLPVCRRLVTAWGGTLTLLSRRGAGTKFTISIPRA